MLLSLSNIKQGKSWFALYSKHCLSLYGCRGIHSINLWKFAHRRNRLTLPLVGIVTKKFSLHEWFIDIGIFGWVLVFPLHSEILCKLYCIIESIKIWSKFVNAICRWSAVSRLWVLLFDWGNNLRSPRLSVSCFVQFQVKQIFPVGIFHGPFTSVKY